jgi:hypothetical protein
LIEGGWSRGSANLRSFLAMEVIRSAMASAQIDEARRALAAVSQPSTFYAILIDNRLAALRPDVEALAGPRLERHWRSYLTKARDDWLSGGDYYSAVAYAAALKQAGYHQLLVDTFLPRFMRGYNCPTDQVSRALAQDIAESFVLLGRWTKADDVMARAGGVSLGAYAGLLLERGEFGRAASYFERSLKSARPPANKEDEKARAWLAAARDCALYRDRHVRPAPSIDTDLLDLPARLRLALCLDQTDQARAMLIAAIDDEDERAAALKWVQPYSEPPTVSAFHKEMGAKVRALQREPAVRQAVHRNGVILDWPLEAAAPAQSEFKNVPVRRASPCNSGWNEDLLEALPKPEDLYEVKPM